MCGLSLGPAKILERPGAQIAFGTGHTLVRMSCSITPGLQGPPCPASVATGREAPPDVYYVVQTLGTVMGEREHRLSSALYEAPSQAHAELARIATAKAGNAYSVWKGSTYIEPARWAHDVVLTDGTVLHPESNTQKRNGACLD